MVGFGVNGWQLLINERSLLKTGSRRCKWAVDVVKG